ncbi:MAG: hypothetical protein WC483_03825 [Candidatus Paceibacterota bacterium]
MSVIKAYTSAAKVAAFLGKTIAAGAADDAINHAVDIIDSLTGRNFIADAAASARLFDGSGVNQLDIDECVAVSKVEICADEWGDSFTEVTLGGYGGYYLLPRNNKDNMGRTLPYTAVLHRSEIWVRGYGNQKITAKWGYSAAVPSAIEFAATILASSIYGYNLAGGGNIKSESIGNYSVSYENEEGWDALNRAKSAIEQYRRIRL